MTLPGICTGGQLTTYGVPSLGHLPAVGTILLSAHDFSSAYMVVTYTIIESGPVENTAEDDTSPECLEDIFSTKCYDVLAKNWSELSVKPTSVLGLE